MSVETIETIENNVGEIIMENNNYGDPQFPYGMRVLVVDDSRVCLKYVTLLLQKCRFQVTAKENSGEALMLLKQNEDNFDIVLTNVRMHEVDGFKLLEAGLEHDIPVIMISANDDLEIIKKGVRHGAVDYLVKPVSLGEIKNIWQHVYRKNLCFVSPRDDIDAPSNKGGTKRSRRKSTSNIGGDDMESASKRERVRWTPALHTKFVDSVAKLGGVDKAVPKKILDMMGEKDVTREKVASHLQKYRKAIKENLMVDRDGGGGKKVRKNKVNSNTNSESHIVDSETLKGGSNFDRSHPTIASNATGGVLASAQPTFTMHQRPQFTTNGWMFNNSFSQPLPMQQVRQSHQLMQQPNIPFDRAFVRPNNIAIPVVNQPSHPHPQPCQPSFGNVRSYYSDPHHQHMSYGTVRSSEEFEDMLFADVPPVSGNGSLLDIVLANESFFDE